MPRQLVDRYGPWAVVTGASDGIGRALTVELAKNGLNVVVVARRKDQLELLGQEIQRLYSIEIRAVSLDFGRERASQELLDSVQDLDVGLFAAVAGFGTSGPLIRSSIISELNMIDVNCRTVVEQCFHFGKTFANKRRGGIILMGSLVGFQGVPNAANYAATKAFVQTLAEGLHFELKRYGVDVLASVFAPKKRTQNLNGSVSS